jgi:hypothetical protein
MSVVAEGMGFEPMTPVSQGNRLAGGRTKPLCDPSRLILTNARKAFNGAHSPTALRMLEWPRATVTLRRFDSNDLERWVAAGIITADQRNAMLADVKGRGPLPGALDMSTLLYYAGGILVLVAYSVFLGLQWEELKEEGRVAIAAASMAFFAAVSFTLLRSERFRLPGELLTVATVAITPLLTFAVLDAAGLWPHEPTNWHFYHEWQAWDQAHLDYVGDLQRARLGMAAASLAVAVVVLCLVRSPFVAAAAAVGLGWLAVEGGQVATGPNIDEFEWGTAVSLLLATAGAVIVALGVALHGRTQRDYTTWLYVLGLTGLVGGLWGRAVDSDALGWGVGFLVVAVLVLLLSIPLQQRLFAIVGVAAAYSYFGKLVFDVFEGSAVAALAMAALGLAIVAMGMLYQRFSQRYRDQMKAG